MVGKQLETLGRFGILLVSLAVLGAIAIVLTAKLQASKLDLPAAAAVGLIGGLGGSLVAAHRFKEDEKNDGRFSIGIATVFFFVAILSFTVM
jgi:hypothetical protein